jgi:hypothetical protein
LAASKPSVRVRTRVIEQTPKGLKTSMTQTVHTLSDLEISKLPVAAADDHLYWLDESGADALGEVTPGLTAPRLSKKTKTRRKVVYRVRSFLFSCAPMT